MQQLKYTMRTHKTQQKINRRASRKQRKQQNINIKNKQTNSKKNRNKQTCRISSPRISANKHLIFIRGDSWAGYPVFMFFSLFYNFFLEAFLFILYLFCMFCLCSHSIYQLLPLQSKKHINNMS